MGLRHIKLPSKVVTFGGGDIEVRGIALEDLMLIVKEHGSQLSLVFARVLTLSEKERPNAIRMGITEVSKEFPQIVTAVIAAAADDYTPDGVDIARKLPFNVQVQCVEAIFDLTFSSEGDIKKLVESLVRMMQAASMTLTELKTSPGGIGVSAAA